MYSRLFVDIQRCRLVSADFVICLRQGIENGKLRIENDVKRSKSVQYLVSIAV
jgi:hypothetical protein